MILFHVAINDARAASKWLQQICCDRAKSRPQVHPPPLPPKIHSNPVQPQRRRRHVLVLTAKRTHAYHRANRVARIHVLKILYSLERAGTEWPAALLWGSTPSGHPAWTLRHQKHIGRGPSAEAADRVVLKWPQLQAVFVLRPRHRLARTHVCGCATQERA